MNVKKVFSSLSASALLCLMAKSTGIQITGIQSTMLSIHGPFGDVSLTSMLSFGSLCHPLDVTLLPTKMFLQKNRSEKKWIKSYEI